MLVGEGEVGNERVCEGREVVAAKVEGGVAGVRLRLHLAAG